jgi:hypothetical protein
MKKQERKGETKTKVESLFFLPSVPPAKKCLCFLCVLDKVDNREKGRSWAALFFCPNGIGIAYANNIPKDCINDNEETCTGD